MENKIKKSVSLLKKERVLITKMIEADEREDSYLFYSLQPIYKKFSVEVDKLINELSEEDIYDEVVESITMKIDEVVNKQERADDLITLLGLVNTFYLNKMSQKVTNFDSDATSNELNMQVYDIYVWLVKNSNFSKDYNDSLRTDLINKVVNSRSMRKYFAGDYEEAMEITNPIKGEGSLDVNQMGMIFASMMLSQIALSDRFEMFEGELDDLSYASRKKMLEIEFAALSTLLTKKGYLIPPNTMDYSDFTEQVMRDASKLYNEYHEKKKKEQTKILIK